MLRVFSVRICSDQTIMARGQVLWLRHGRQHPAPFTGERTKRREHWTATLSVYYTGGTRRCWDIALSFVGKVFSGAEWYFTVFRES